MQQHQLESWSEESLPVFVLCVSRVAEGEPLAVGGWLVERDTKMSGSYYL